MTTALYTPTQEDLCTDREVRRKGAHQFFTFEPAKVKPD